jgi:RNA polymerase sigma-70 factor, ECF subfamily
MCLRIQGRCCPVNAKPARAALRTDLQDQHRQFERTVWPHLRGAYNLARWLVGNRQDAEDVVQESFLKAFRAVDRVRGDDARAWILTIVRNTALNYLQRQKPKSETGWDEHIPEPEDHTAGPETSLLQKERRARVRSAIGRLPAEFREALVLREIEGLPYKEIAWVLKVPMGTVMSRLSRARNLLLQELIPDKEESHDLCGS